MRRNGKKSKNKCRLKPVIGGGRRIGGGISAEEIKDCRQKVLLNGGVLNLELKSIMNSPALWISSIPMVVIIVLQSVLFLKKALQTAEELNMSRDRYMAGMRSAAITSIGPSLGPVIVLVALITLIGAPSTWLSLCNIGAARTEMAVAAMGARAAGVDLQSANFGLLAFSYALWAIALNNSGWMVMSLFTTSRMSSIIKTVNRRYDPKWIKVLMGSTVIALFASLLAPTVINSKMVINKGNLIAAVVSALTMVLISKVIARYIPKLQELSLGISMLVGMLAATALK